MSSRKFSFPAFLTFCLALIFLSLAQAPVVQAQEESTAPPTLTFTTIDVPGAVATDVYGINTAGDMVGGYSNADGSSGGFLLRNGNFSLFNYPGGTFTNPRGINDADIIVGNAYVKHNTAAVSFLYDGNAFTTIRAPGKSATIANGINNAGTIVGGDGTLGTTVGFELVGSKFESFSPPPHNYIYVYGTGVNNVGELVGWTAGAAPNGFARQSGKYKTVTFPASSMTEVWGVNDNGVIVGWYTQNESPYDSFGFAFIQGTYISLSYPGAINTFGFGINAAGQIVGTYTLDNSTYHGFVTSPIAAAEMAGQ